MIVYNMYAYFGFDNYTLICICVRLLTHMWCVLGTTNSQKSLSIIPRSYVYVCRYSWICDVTQEEPTYNVSIIPLGYAHMCHDSCICAVTHAYVTFLTWMWFHSRRTNSQRIDECFLNVTHSYALVCHDSYVIWRIRDSLMYACVLWRICHMTYLSHIIWPISLWLIFHMTYLAESHMGWPRSHQMATVSRIDQITGLFCRI